MDYYSEDEFEGLVIEDIEKDLPNADYLMIEREIDNEQPPADGRTQSDSLLPVVVLEIKWWWRVLCHFVANIADYKKMDTIIVDFVILNPRY